MSTSRVPYQLTEKYEALLGERSAALTRIEELDQELDYLDYSLSSRQAGLPRAKFPKSSSPPASLAG